MAFKEHGCPLDCISEVEKTLIGNILWYKNEE